MEQNNPKVSVVVLVYNQERTITRTFDHILNQKTSFDYEIIVGEDCSIDNSRLICEEYAELYKDKIKLLPQAPNKGLLINYRDCLAKCTGEYIAVCAGDDWWHNSKKLQIQVEFMDAHPESVLVFTNYDIFHAAYNKYSHSVLPAESLNTRGIIDKLLRGFFLPTLTILYRRRLLQYIDLNEFKKRGYQAEDLPMFLEFALHGSLDCINVSTSTYTAMAGSLSHFDNTQKMERFMLNMRDIKINFIETHPDITSVLPLEIIVLYNRLIFNASFALLDRGKALQYVKMISVLYPIERKKKMVCKIRPLFGLYCLLKKFFKRG